MSDPVPTAADLRQAGQRLAATLRSVPDDGGPGWEPRFPGGPFPEDYVALVSRTGPGTLAGVLRLLAPGCDDGSGRFDGFDIEAERRKHAPPHPEALLWGVCTSGETCWWLPFHDDPPAGWWRSPVAGISNSTSPPPNSSTSGWTAASTCRLFLSHLCLAHAP
jgi:hypothetical protein